MTNYSAPYSNPNPPNHAAQPGESRTAAMLAHLSGPISAAVSAGWLAIVGPLLVWLLYKDKDAFVRHEAADAFNFQVTMWLVALVGGVLCITVILIPLGVLMIIAAVLASVIVGIIAAVKASGGQPYNYPWKLSFLS